MPAWRRTKLVPGLYDEPVSEHLQREVVALGTAALLNAARTNEAGIAGLEAWLGEAVGLTLQSVAKRKDHATAMPALVQEVMKVLQRHAPGVFSRPAELMLTDQWLQAVTEGGAKPPERPKGSLHAPSLLVNAEGEHLLDHLRSEFDSADRVDLLCAFIKLSGFEKFRREFERLCSARGRTLRVLTTTYMGASDAAAIERLAALPNCEVKVSYDADSTRLHAKAWVFHRDNGYSTSYVGSSNLSHAAQTDGLEWNVRVTEQGQPALLQQMAETFAQYWADPYQFTPFTHGDVGHRQKLVRALSADRRSWSHAGALFELEAKDFQQQILDELQAARSLGRHINLLVAATGTGKTVMAALDFRRLREAKQAETLLFVAHRKEILVQARDTYRNALQLRDFGELLVDGEQPSIGKHVFASIASLGEGGQAARRGLDPAAFDVVVIDEAHHAPAETWDKLLARVKPKELLGLTGTPERADGLDHEQHFPRPWVGNLRVWNAIPHALVPFRYYMLDVAGVDLRDVAWVAGKYAERELSGLLVGAAEIFVQRAVRALREYVARPEALRAIAFCVDKAHAREVQRRFEAHGLRAEVLTSDTDTLARGEARGRLDSGEIQVLCVVDIYNEGVDVPNVNTLFFFRPTESATVFLQQLGRGLRRAPGKPELVVFDLTGRQHHNFRFDRKLRGALGHTPKELEQFVASGFGRLPAGCFFHFDVRAQAEVLAQIRRSIPSQWKDIAKLLREPQLAGLTLDAFLHATDVDLADIYANKRGWTLLRREAGLPTPLVGEEEGKVLERLGKLTHVGDPLRLGLWERLLRGETAWAPRDLRLANMLYVVLYGGKLAASGEAATRFKRDAMVRAELLDLIPVLRRLNGVLAPEHQLAAAVPLVLHAQYLAGELAAAFDVRTKEGELREAYYTGVEAVKDGGHNYDLLLVTLEKSAGTKEHLKYRDFPLSERRFHWHSKAGTTVESKEGRRHRLAEELGVTPLLLVREREKNAGRTEAFQYLGPVRAASWSGERPMTVEWEMRYAMPAEVVACGRVVG